MSLPRVYFDIEIDGLQSGRIVMEVGSSSDCWLHLLMCTFYKMNRKLYILMLLPVWTKCKCLLYSWGATLSQRLLVGTLTRVRVSVNTTVKAVDLHARWGRAVGELATASLKNHFWSQTKQWRDRFVWWWGGDEEIPTSFQLSMLCWPESVKPDWPALFRNQNIVTWVFYKVAAYISCRKLPCFVHWREGLWLCGQQISQNHPEIHVPGRVKALAVCQKYYSNYLQLLQLTTVARLHSVRVEILPKAMELEENPSMGRSLRMKTSLWSTRNLWYCLWPMLVPTQTDPSFLFALPRLTGKLDTKLHD